MALAVDPQLSELSFLLGAWRADELRYELSMATREVALTSHVRSRLTRA